MNHLTSPPSVASKRSEVPSDSKPSIPRKPLPLPPSSSASKTANAVLPQTTYETVQVHTPLRPLSKRESHNISNENGGSTPPLDSLGWSSASQPAVGEDSPSRRLSIGARNRVDISLPDATSRQVDGVVSNASPSPSPSSSTSSQTYQSLQPTKSFIDELGWLDKDGKGIKHLAPQTLIDVVSKKSPKIETWRKRCLTPESRQKFDEAVTLAQQYVAGGRNAISRLNLPLFDEIERLLMDHALLDIPPRNSNNVSILENLSSKYIKKFKDGYKERRLSEKYFIKGDYNRQLWKRWIHCALNQESRDSLKRVQSVVEGILLYYGSSQQTKQLTSSLVSILESHSKAEKKGHQPESFRDEKEEPVLPMASSRGSGVALSYPISPAKSDWSIAQVLEVYRPRRLWLTAGDLHDFRDNPLAIRTLLYICNNELSRKQLRLAFNALPRENDSGRHDYKMIINDVYKYLSVHRQYEKPDEWRIDDGAIARSTLGLHEGYTELMRREKLIPKARKDRLQKAEHRPLPSDAADLSLLEIYRPGERLFIDQLRAIVSLRDEVFMALKKRCKEASHTHLDDAREQILRYQDALSKPEKQEIINEVIKALTAYEAIEHIDFAKAVRYAAVIQWAPFRDISFYDAKHCELNFVHPDFPNLNRELTWKFSRRELDLLYDFCDGKREIDPNLLWRVAEGPCQVKASLDAIDSMMREAKRSRKKK